MCIGLDSLVEYIFSKLDNWENSLLNIGLSIRGLFKYLIIYNENSVTVCLNRLIRFVKPLTIGHDW